MGTVGWVKKVNVKLEVMKRLVLRCTRDLRIGSMFTGQDSDVSKPLGDEFPDSTLRKVL